MNNIPPTSPVFRQSYHFLHCQSRPFLYVAQPVCSRSSSFPFSRHCALHDVFLHAYSLSSHDVSEINQFSFFYRLQQTPLHSCHPQHPFICPHFRPRYIHDQSQTLHLECLYSSLLLPPQCPTLTTIYSHRPHQCSPVLYTMMHEICHCDFDSD